MASTLAGRAETPTQAKILRLLRDEGQLSRVALADRLDLSRTTVATEVARLAELGLAVDAGPGASRGGRRSTLVDIAPGLRFVGVDIGATSLDVAMTDGRLGILAQLSEGADVRTGPERVLGRVLELVRKLLTAEGVDRAAGVGVGVPGPVDFNAGIPVEPPIMPGWHGYPVRDAIARELGCPVLLDNDVNVMALGEQHAGVAKQAPDFLFVKIGTGIGCGIVVDRHLYRGVDGCAGDIGHIRVEEFGPACPCGNTGCLEAVDVPVILPHDGKALTEVGLRAMQSGIPVVNLDRIFDSPLAYRTWIGGDNYGMGVAAANYIAEQLEPKGVTNPVIPEIPGIDSLPLTQDRSRGFSEALATHGLKVGPRVPAEFTVESGEEAAANLLQAAPKIDALWNHDDDQGIGVLSAIESAGRREFLMVGGAGSRNAFEAIKADNTVLKATVTYSPSMASSAISIARLIANGQGMSDLVEKEVPASITLASATVTKDNVDEYMEFGFAS